MPNPTAPTAAPKSPKIAVTTDRPIRLAPPPKPPKPGPTPEDHEANLHTAVAAARENPDAHTLSEVEGHVAPLHDMDPPTAIKVAARVTGQQGLRRKSDAIQAVRSALAPNYWNKDVGDASATTYTGPKGPLPSIVQSAPKVHKPNVDETGEDGITHASRVGVPGKEVPDRVPIIPNLTPEERRHETDFRKYYEADPEGVSDQYLKHVLAQTPAGEVPSFETDDAKNLHAAWNGHGIPLEDRAKNRATLNVALHQTANAIAKKAFLKHLDTLPEGSKVLVTNGGCGAGKGYTFEKDENGQPRVPAGYALKQQAKAVWDSAGDQNGTETPWIKQELDKRGLKGIYSYVHVDPRQSWANPKRGVVQRATNIKNGRMVDAHVFADSYALGAKNMHAFHQQHKDDPNSEFMFTDNTGMTPKVISGVPEADLGLDRKELAQYAHEVVHKAPVPEHIKYGATAGKHYWGMGS